MRINRHKIIIDSKDFATDTLSDEVKGNLAATQFTDAEIQCLQAKLAGIKTTRMAYARAVQEGLNGKPAAAPIADISGDTIQFN